MSFLQWLLLILVIALVEGAYAYIRRQSDNDPWRGMDDSDDRPGGANDGFDPGAAGDSYIVGVRTLSKDSAQARKEEAARRAAERADASQTANDRSRPLHAVPPSAGPRRASVPEPEADPAPRPDPAPAGPEPAEPAPRRSAPAERPAAPAEPPALAAEDHGSERIENIRMPRGIDGVEPQIFMLHVAASDERLFDGPDIHRALAEQGLKFGLNDVYHRVTEIHGVPESVFAVANMLKPGTLDPVDQDHLQTPGLVLFIVVPGALEGAAAMRDMMETAHAIAQALGGDVLDDKRALLKAQTARAVLDEIAEIDRKARIAQRRR